MVEEFDLEKVESLDFDNLAGQLQYIFKDDQDIENFVNFLKNIQKFVMLSNDKRHQIQIELGYFKSQIQMFEKKIQNMIAKKKNEQIKNAVKRAKGSGEKITENIITYYTESTTGLDSLEELLILVSAWSNYMNDLYFVCGQTSKNLGGFS